MSRAGCCCGGGPDPGECCETGGYLEQGRRYQVSIQVGAAPGNGLNLQVKYDSEDCGTFDCDPFYCPGQTAIVARGMGPVTTDVSFSWGGGNGIYSYAPIFPKWVLVDCSPCWPGSEDQPVDRVYTQGVTPNKGAGGTLQYIEPTGGSWTVSATWISGDIDSVYNVPSVEATIYRGITQGAQANVHLRGCYDDAPCPQGRGMVVRAYLPFVYNEPCNAFGSFLDGTDAYPASAQALYHGCPDRDNRYANENRYGVRVWKLNRVNKCGTTGFAYFTDGVETPFASANLVKRVVGVRWEFSAPGDVCADGTFPNGQLWERGVCNDPSTTPYNLSITDNYPEDCPFKVDWFDPLTVPHPFPATIEVVRLAPPPPTITFRSPTSGPAAGGTLVTIQGTNFIQVTDVLFGGNRCASLIGNTATSVLVAAPPGTAGQTVSITVTTDGGSATFPNAYTYT